MKAPQPKEFFKRLREALADFDRALDKRGTKTWIAKTFDVKQPTVTEWFRDMAYLPEAFRIQSMAEVLSVNYQWLYSGKGPKRGADNEPDYDDITGFSQAVGLGQESEIAEYEETHKLKFRADSLGRKKLRAPHLSVVYGKGDSMLPRIKSGDAILFDMSDKTPRDEKIFIICYPSRTGGTACSAKQCMELDGMFYFKSLNNDGDHDWKKPRRMDDEKRPIEIMGRVRWIGSWED